MILFQRVQPRGAQCSTSQGGRGASVTREMDPEERGAELLMLWLVSWDWEGAERGLWQLWPVWLTVRYIMRELEEGAERGRGSRGGLRAATR